MKHLNLILVVFVLVLTAACNSCQKTATIEAVKVESSINVQAQDMDCSNIVIDPAYPLNECGILKDGKITVRSIVCHSNTVKENQIIAGVLYITGEAIDNKSIK